MKRVLSVGQCGFDHAAIRRMIEGQFDAEVLAVANSAAADAELRRGAVDLVLVNRVLDADGSEGLEIIRGIKQDAQLGHVPVMMVTNYPDCQLAAVSAGAESGFGKQELNDPATAAKLARFLS